MRIKMIVPLRNDWKASLRKGIDLCRKYGHQGDAATIEDVLNHLEGPHGVTAEHRVNTQKENGRLWP